MKEFTATVIDPVGLHARPATISVGIANKFKCNVTITSQGNSLNMKSILCVMSLAVPTDAEITVKCEGEDEEEAVEAIKAKMLEHNIIKVD